MVFFGRGVKASNDVLTELLEFCVFVELSLDDWGRFCCGHHSSLTVTFELPKTARQDEFSEPANVTEQDSLNTQPADLDQNTPSPDDAALQKDDNTEK
jgi:hypothetical protein